MHASSIEEIEQQSVVIAGVFIGLGLGVCVISDAQLYYRGKIEAGIGGAHCVECEQGHRFRYFTTASVRE